MSMPVVGQLPEQKQELVDYMEQRYATIPERIRKLKPEKGVGAER